MGEQGSDESYGANRAYNYEGAREKLQEIREISELLHVLRELTRGVHSLTRAVERLVITQGGGAAGAIAAITSQVEANTGALEAAVEGATPETPPAG